MKIFSPHICLPRILLSSLITACLLSLPIPTWANTVTKIAASSDNAEIDKVFTLTFTFADNSKPIACGMKIDWGDGKTDRLRFGDGQQVLPPYTIEHTYTSAGQYKLQINGDLISRGLKTVFGCDVKREGALTVFDPIEVARQAQEKAALEKTKLEQLQAQQIANQARLAKESEERAKREADNQVRLAKDAEERAKREADLISKMKTLLAKASIKSCDQFIDAFKQRYQFAYDWPVLNCVISNENDGAFKIVAHNPSRSGNFAYNRFYYQPQTETVLQEAASYSATLRAANFIDVKKATDMNAEGEIELRNLPFNQQQQVCSKINNAATNVIIDHDFRIAAGYEVAEIAKAGNWEFNIIKTEKNCAIRFDVAGTFQGNSHRKSVTCGIGKVIKRGNNFQVLTVDVYSGNRCR